MFLASDSLTIELDCKAPVTITSLAAEYMCQGTVVIQQLLMPTASTSSGKKATGINAKTGTQPSAGLVSEIAAGAGVSKHTLVMPVVLDSSEKLTFIINGTFRSDSCKIVGQGDASSDAKKKEPAGSVKVRWDLYFEDIKSATMVLEPLKETTSILKTLTASLTTIQTSLPQDAADGLRLALESIAKRMATCVLASSQPSATSGPPSAPSTSSAASERESLLVEHLNVVRKAAMGSVKGMLIPCLHSRPKDALMDGLLILDGDLHISCQKIIGAIGDVADNTKDAWLGMLAVIPVPAGVCAEVRSGLGELAASIASDVIGPVVSALPFGSALVAVCGAIYKLFVRARELDAAGAALSKCVAQHMALLREAKGRAGAVDDKALAPFLTDLEASLMDAYREMTALHSASVLRRTMTMSPASLNGRIEAVEKSLRSLVTAKGLLMTPAQAQLSGESLWRRSSSRSFGRRCKRQPRPPPVASSSSGPHWPR